MKVIVCSNALKDYTIIMDYVVNVMMLVLNVMVLEIVHVNLVILVGY